MKNIGYFLTIAVLAALTPPVGAQTFTRRATLINTNNPSEARCTVSVVVDGAADVEIRSDTATLRDVTGDPPRWRRFECTEPLPYTSTDLHIRAVEGNGKVTLTHDSYNGGVAVVRVTNLEGGDQLYTFDVFWSPRQSAYRSSDADRVVLDDDAIQSCRSAVENRVRNDGYRNVRFGRVSMDDRGASDWVTGTATASRSYGSEAFSFSCRVNPSDGEVRRLDVTRR
jgi:hypothetical protein